MRHAYPLFIVTLLTACDSGPADEQVQRFYGHWARSQESCADDAFEFSGREIADHADGAGLRALPVRRVRVKSDEPDVATFIIKVSDEMAAASNTTETSDIALQFRVIGDRLVLIGEGSPYRLFPVTPEQANYHRFNLVRCVNPRSAR